MWLQHAADYNYIYADWNLKILLVFEFLIHLNGIKVIPNKTHNVLPYIFVL